MNVYVSYRILDQEIARTLLFLASFLCFANSSGQVFLIQVSYASTR